ncbi:MAG TPA: NAD-dependent epimerase/dehydratase family protein [Polyangiaceae bacterium]
MSKGPIVVTGATGLVGYGLVQALVERGEHVRALVRDPDRARSALPPAVELAIGDVTEPSTLLPALAGAELVFHAAGMPEQWQRDEGIFDRVNRQGTKNVLEAALAASVRRVVYTSTMDVFAAPRGGTLRETEIDTAPKPTAYERSKQAAEREASDVEKRGLDVVYVNPAAVYGPSLGVTALNAFFAKLLANRVPLLPPGGMSVAFIDGVVQAHLAAAERGRRGERYLVSDDHLSMPELAARVLEAADLRRKVPATAPLWLLNLLVAISEPPARWFGFAPLVAAGELSFLLWNVHVDASKAQRELGFRPTPVSEGVRRTVEALKRRGS